jgi:signal transduction histidine kinase
MTRRSLGQAVGTLLFLLAAVPVGAVALAVLIAGWVVVAVVSITPLVVPALVAFRTAVGALARLDAELARELLGTSVTPPTRSAGPPGFWRKAGNVLYDDTFWKQQAYLLVRLTVGFGLAVAAWALLAASLGLVAMPAWYWTTDVQIADSWHVDSLGRALLCVPAGILGLALTFWLVRLFERFSRHLVAGLLSGSTQPPQVRSRERRRSLTLHAATYVVLNGLLILIWALTGAGYFWPEWVLLPLGLVLATHAWSVFVDDQPRFARKWGMPRGLAMHEGIVASLAVFLVLVWAVTGGGYFWPIWPIIGLVTAFLVHAAVAFSRRGERIAQLEATRAGAVDLQDSELRRIERDLHDGAQARLVALGMSLGMAEQKLASDPHAAQQLLAEARRGTQEALEELRGLARGIHPPVLADRGLEAAIAALADRTPLKVNVAVDIDRRPPAPVETAAYFVVAEALANTGKHAHAKQVDIGIHVDDDLLVVEIVDDGDGGADPSGNGLSGLARRVEALDGTLVVTSPPGGPTTIRAVMPCGS